MIWATVSSRSCFSDCIEFLLLQLKRCLAFALDSGKLFLPYPTRVSLFHWECVIFLSGINAPKCLLCKSDTVFLKNCQVLFQSSWNILHFHSNYEWFSILTSLPAFGIVIIIIIFEIISSASVAGHRRGIRSHHDMVLSCISLVSSDDAKHLFLFLFASIYALQSIVSTWFFGLFSNWIVAFLMSSFENSLSIQDTNYSSALWLESFLFSPLIL